MSRRKLTLEPWNGTVLSLEWSARTSTEAPVDAGRLVLGVAAIDLGTLPGRLYNLVPAGYFRATTDHWDPFIREAILRGLL